MSQNDREKEGLFKGADALAVVTGSANDDELYSKSASLQNWLLGYEFPDTCIVIGNRSITILTSSKKGVPRRSPSLLTYPLHRTHAPALWYSHFACHPLAFSCTAAPLARSACPHGAYLPPCARCQRVRVTPVMPAMPGACAVQYLQPLVEAENATLPLELIASEKKSADKNKSKYEQLVSAIKSSHSGAIVGCLVEARTALRRRRPGCERPGAGRPGSGCRASAPAGGPAVSASA